MSSTLPETLQSVRFVASCPDEVGGSSALFMRRKILFLRAEERSSWQFAPLLGLRYLPDRHGAFGLLGCFAAWILLAAVGAFAVLEP